MSFGTVEVSLDSGQPQELYQFQVGGVFHRYTQAQATVTVTGADYLPLQISRTSPAYGADRFSGRLEIRVPNEIALVQPYIGIVLHTRPVVTIFRKHPTDAGVQTYWKGFITSVAFDGSFAKLLCDPIQQLFTRELPRQTFQGLCNHVLYDGGCGVTRGNFQNSVTVSAITNGGDTLVLNSLSTARPADATFFKGGIISRANGDSRLILDYTFATDTVRMLMPFPNLLLGETVTAAAGCAHSTTVCRTKFENIVRFGGFPFVPTINPFSTGVVPEIVTAGPKPPPKFR